MIVKGLVLEKERYSAEEFAQLVGKTVRTIREWIRTGKVEHVKEGGRTYVVSDPADYTDVTKEELDKRKMLLIANDLDDIKHTLLRLREEIDKLSINYKKREQKGAKILNELRDKIKELELHAIEIRKDIKDMKRDISIIREEK